MLKSIVDASIAHAGSSCDQGKASWVPTERNEPIFLREFASSQSPRAVLFYIHGLHEHSGTRGNLDLCSKLSQRGFHVFAHDHTGHGQSATVETLGVVSDWRHLVDDAHLVLKAVHDGPQWNQLQRLPFFIIGQSLGGMTALILSHRLQNLKKEGKDEVANRFSGLVGLAPAIWQTLEPPAAEVFLLKGLRLIGFGQSRLGPAPRREMYPSDEAYDIFMKDPLCYAGKMVLDTGFTLIQMTEHVQSIISEVAFPLGIFHGTDDKVIPYWGSENLIKLSMTAAADKKLYTYPDASHGLLYDDNSKTVVADIADWLESRLGGIVSSS